LEVGISAFFLAFNGITPYDYVFDSYQSTPQKTNTNQNVAGAEIEHFF